MWPKYVAANGSFNALRLAMPGSHAVCLRQPALQNTGG